MLANFLFVLKAGRKLREMPPIQLRQSSTGKNVARDSFLLVPAFLVPGIVNTASVVIFARLLGPGNYGILAIAQTSALIAATIGGQWTRQSTLRFLPTFIMEEKREEAGFGIGVLLLLSAVIMIVFGSLAGFYFKYSPFVSNVGLIQAISFYSVSYLLFENVNACNQASLAMTRFSIVRASGFSLSFIFSVIGAYWIAATADVVLFSGGIGLLLVTVFTAKTSLGIRSLYFWRIRTFTKSGLRLVVQPFLKYGIPIGTWMILVTLLNWSDRWLLGWQMGVIPTGIYSSIYSLVAMSMGLAFTPFLGSVHSHTMSLWSKKAFRDLSDFYSSIIRLYLLISSVVFVIALGSGDWIVRLVLGNDYAVAPGLPVLISLGFLFWQFAMIAHKGLEVTGSTRLMIKSILIALVINVCMNLSLIPFIGLYAPGLSTIVGFGVYSVLVIKPSREILYWEGSRKIVVTVIFVIIFSSLIFLVGMFLSQSYPEVQWWFRCIFAVVGPLVVMLIAVFVGEIPVRMIVKSSLVEIQHRMSM